MLQASQISSDLLKEFGNAIDGVLCTGIAQRRGGPEQMGWGFPWCRGGSTRCGSDELWLEKVVAEQVPFLLEGLRTLHPLLTRREICVTGVILSDADSEEGQNEVGWVAGSYHWLGCMPR